MADSIRERIIKAAVVRAGTILTANGYKTNAGDNACRASKTHDPDTEYTVVVIPKPEESEKAKFGKMIHTFPVDLIAAVKIDIETESASEVSETVYADLIKAFTNPEEPFSPLIKSITHTGGGGLELPNNEETFAGATASFEIKYQTALGDPEAQ